MPPPPPPQLRKESEEWLFPLSLPPVGRKERYIYPVLRIRIRMYFRPPGPGSISKRYRSCTGSGSFYNQAKIVRKTLIPTDCDFFMTFYL
jgi:hypothetical protein